ncbi:MAG: hypothetical protein IJ091_02630 [Oscillospiraceae bacterium]|nr:hypothetical protein [Oscillospiraceae bacterium]
MIKRIPTFVVLFLCLFAMMILSIVLPKQTYSENENKYLASLPDFSLRSFGNSSFETKYSTYLSDQLPGRGTWISAKSVAETFLLKTENNGIAYGKDGYMFPKFQSYDEDTYRDNLESIHDLTQVASSPVRLLVVPSAYTVLTDYVPDSLPCIDEKAALADGISVLNGVQIVDTWSALQDAQHDYIYYRTDHHWTTYGAYLAYLEYCEEADLEPVKVDFSTAGTATGFLGTSYSKCKRVRTIADTISYFPFDATLTFDGKTYPSIYDFTKLTTRDKYAMFLYGNHAESVVESGDGNGKRGSLLIIKDSYADSVIPFLSNNYATITCIDPRYYLGSIQELAKGDYDDILLLLGFENLSSEGTWVKLSF